MDDSQSSDILSERTDIFCSSLSDTTIINTETYESLILHTKSTFPKVCKDIKKSTFAESLINLLEDCNVCISQSLQLITVILSESDININKLIEYMNDAAHILQLLSDLIKNVTEKIQVTFSTMKTFPMVTGHIILLVFTHCKDSESIYGSHLSSVAKYIKDLFRVCHDLQLTYLTVLEKHYVFDLTDEQELDILIEALEVNLKIGQIVQSLDVKTMAEQWKAYTVICEKYSTTLMDKNVYNKCTKILCAMITNNLKTALEENQEEKVMLRSLKVNNFILKILLRVCITFKQATDKDYTSIIELLIYINLNNDAYLQRVGEKSSQLIHLFMNNVTSPANTLLGELLYDNRLLECICDYDIHRISRDEKMLGLILLVISTIKSLLQKGGDQLATLQKHRLINVTYSFLPFCHVWFNMDLNYKCMGSNQLHYETTGLYEYLLTYTVTLASMMILEEIHILERRMLEALLGTDCTSAIFTCNLWTLLARLSSRQFHYSQVVSLIQTYQKLETTSAFQVSPQRTHLTHTIRSLFEIMAEDDKKNIYNMFSICDEKNLGLWSSLEVRSLPNELQCHAEGIAIELFKKQLRNLVFNENFDIDIVIKSFHLASTCSCLNQDEELHSLIIDAWSKACPNTMSTMSLTTTEIHSGNLWCYNYIEALVAVTNTMVDIFDGNSFYLIKTLHVIHSIVQGGCKELNLLLIDILCKLAIFETNDMNKHLSDSILVQTFKELFTNSDLTVRNKLFNILRGYKSFHLNKTVSNIINNDESLKEAWNHLLKHGTLKKRTEFSLKNQLLNTMNFEYTHKCLKYVEENTKCEVLPLQKSLSSNFDLIDVDSLFDTDCDNEPAYKKVKLNNNRVEEIICRLESDMSLLSEIKEDIVSTEHRNRLKTLCNKFNNIIN